MAESVIAAIHQPNYAPWCGYFAKMAHCDVFVLLDDAQMPGGQSYVYRSRLRAASGTRWLSVPTRSVLGDPISSVQFADPKWTQSHLGILHSTYRSAPFWREVSGVVGPVYDAPGESVSAFNGRLVEVVARYLGITCAFRLSSDLPVVATGDDRLIGICEALGADSYLSGPGGTNYQDPGKFQTAGIRLVVREYVPVGYECAGFPFVPGLSIFDALFCVGQGARRLLTYDRLGLGVGS